MSEPDLFELTGERGELLKHVLRRLSRAQRLELALALARSITKTGSGSWRWKSKYRRYEDYLLSPRWKSLQRAVLVRANSQCEFPSCSAAARDVHHIAYPEAWGEEPIYFLVALCGHHHQVMHSDDEK